MKINNRYKESNNHNIKELNKKTILTWFKDDIDKKIIKYPLESKDYEKIYNSLYQDDEFIILFFKAHETLVVPLSNISKNVTKRAFKNFNI